MRDSGHREEDTYVYKRDVPAEVAPERQSALQPHGGTLRGKNRASKNLRLNLLIGGLIALLAVCVILAAVLPGCQETTPMARAAAPAPTSATSVAPSSSDVVAGTVLPQTPDAGQAYVDETLFLGDSNTARLLEYSNVTGLTPETCIGVEGMGIQSVIGNTLVSFEGMAYACSLPDAVAVLQPRRVVVTFGTNNIGGYTADAFTDAYETVLDDIRRAYPSVDIIVGAVPPVAGYCSYVKLEMALIDEYNAALENMAKRQGCKFLNWTEVLLDPETGFCKDGYTVGDGLHISEDGARVMMRYFRTHSYITEDDRPQPLAYIPARLELPKQQPSPYSNPIIDAGGWNWQGDQQPGSSSQPAFSQEPEPQSQPESQPQSQSQPEEPQQPEEPGSAPAPEPTDPPADEQTPVADPPAEAGGEGTDA